ncbi:hypothetical protein CAPTEDRAFT_74351, partial [Capitella teleta]
GTLLVAEQECSNCHASVTWSNKKYVGRIPGINLALSCAILFSGSTPTKALHMLDILGVQSIGYSSFMEHQRNFLQPAVKEVWLAEQKAVLQVAKQAEGGAAVGGDSRCDSPGHCTKFGSYSLMDSQSGKIIDVQLVQSNEVGGSYHMELEGLKCCWKTLTKNRVKVKTVVTDRHVQIRSYIKKDVAMKDVDHRFDVWHIAKSFKKKMLALSARKECSELQGWIKSAVNHLYWVASSTPDGNGPLMLAKWLSIANHLQNVHHNHGDPL